MKKQFLTLIGLFIFCTSMHSQECPILWNEILEFKKNDSIDKPRKDAILFVGSSSFKMWENIETYFPEHNIINRGFGGATLSDIVRYYYDIVHPYRPKQVVIYAGENDLAFQEHPNAKIVAQRFKTLYSMIRANYPGIIISFVSIKPSPSREHLMNISKLTNEKIKKEIAKDPFTNYIDVFSPMLDKQGRIRSDLFINDNLHLNEKGYKLWQKHFLPYLL